MIRILAISGSLRTGSTNTVLLVAAAALAPPGVQITLYSGLADLPAFNPDLDLQPPIPAVADFRAHLNNSSAVMISSPEYAHGVPGVLKNALDWLVASGELYGKPTALFSASSRATYAQAFLTETLTVMTATIVPQACITVPLLGKNLVPSDIISYPEHSQAIRAALAELVRVTTPAQEPLLAPGRQL
jgi:chromate reductase